MQDVSVSITLDGNAIGRYYLAPGQKMLPGLYVSETLTKPFRFRDLVLTSMDSIVLCVGVVTDSYTRRQGLSRPQLLHLGQHGLDRLFDLQV